MQRNIIVQRWRIKPNVERYNAPFVSVEIVQFAPRCLGATVFRNEMVKTEMTHK